MNRGFGGEYTSSRSYRGNVEDDRRGWNAEYEQRDELGRFMPEHGTRGYGGRRRDIEMELEERSERAERMPRDQYGQFIPEEQGWHGRGRTQGRYEEEGRGYSSRSRSGYGEQEEHGSRSRGGYGHEEEGRHGMSRSEAGRIGGYHSHGEPAPGERGYGRSSSGNRSRGRNR
jgi:hypothetical protein